MIVALNKHTDSRIKSWSKHTHRPPQDFIHEAVEQYLDDWEDYRDALTICSEIDAGRMKVYSLDDVERHLDEIDSLER